MATATRKKPVLEAVKTAQEPVRTAVSDMDAILSGDFGSGSSESAISKVKTRAIVDDARVRQAAGELADKVIDVGHMTDDEKAATRVAILTANIDELRSAAPGNRQALGKLVAAVKSSISGLGEDFAQAQEFNASEMRVIEHAQIKLDEAKKKAAESEEDLKNAQARKLNIFHIRDRAIAAAIADGATADTAVKQAEADIEEAQRVAANMRDERLQDADFEESYATITRYVEETKTVIADRINMLDSEAINTQCEKEIKYKQKLQAAKNLESSQVEVDELHGKLELAVAEQDTLEVGSSDRAAKESEVSQLQRTYEQRKAYHDQQLVVFQELEHGTKALEVHETGLRVGLHAHKVALAQLVASSGIWVTEFRTQIAQIKATASQKAYHDMVELGFAVRQAHVKHSAEFAIGSLANVTDLAKRHPGQMRDLAAVASAMREGLQTAAAEWEKIEAETKAGNGGSTATPET